MQLGVRQSRSILRRSIGLQAGPLWYHASDSTYYRSGRLTTNATRAVTKMGSTAVSDHARAVSDQGVICGLVILALQYVDSLPR